MGNTSSRATPSTEPSVPIIATAEPIRTGNTSFGRAQTMIDVQQALTGAGDNSGTSGGALPRSSSDTALNTSYQAACQKSYQQSLEWGRNEHFFKLAHTFHTNNY